MKLSPLTVLLSLVLLTACGSESASTPQVLNDFCQFSSANYCESWTGYHSGSMTFANYCTSSSGTVVSSCSTSACVGTCLFTGTNEGTTATVKTYYYSNLTTAQTSCSESGGTFSSSCQ